METLKTCIILSVIFFNTFLFSVNINFSNPISTPSGITPPNLSKDNQDAFQPQIATNSSGRYVYAIWAVIIGSDYFIQVAISSDYGQTWNNPQSTPLGTTSPNLSIASTNAHEDKITCDSSGRYVYAIWQRNNAANNVIQIAISSDYGQSWSNPISTVGGTPNLSDPSSDATIPKITTDESGKNVYAIWTTIGAIGTSVIRVSISSEYGQTWNNPTSTPKGTPNLSEPASLTINSADAQITCDSLGKYVYAIWSTVDSSFFITNTMQVAISSDYGQTWVYPVSTPPGTTSPNLSIPSPFFLSNLPKIITSNSGKYVYAVWTISSPPIFASQLAISSDYGQTWNNPLSTPSGTTSPNLSDPNIDALNSRITIDNLGKFVYVVWQREDGINSIIQVVISSDYGQTWSHPLSLPPGALYPGISTPFAGDSKIITDSSGRYIYVIWIISSPSYFIQAAVSSDFGLTWDYPSSTPPGTSSPNLSIASSDAGEAQITTDQTGRNIYVIWVRFNGSKDIIQEANGIKTFFPITSLSFVK